MRNYVLHDMQLSSLPLNPTAFLLPITNTKLSLACILCGNQSFAMETKTETVPCRVCVSVIKWTLYQRIHHIESQSKFSSKSYYMLTPDPRIQQQENVRDASLIVSRTYWNHVVIGSIV